jgi:NAD dependent epimerase/dehydratase
MKKALVTGAGGFIGSHLTELLLSKGVEVKAFVHYNSQNNWGWLEKSRLKNEIEIISGDIRDSDSVGNAMASVDSVFHLAALIGIPYSYVSPLAYIRTNIEGTYNVLQASRNTNIDNIIITSTSETYGTAQYVPIDENHPKVGQSPYSASKIAADEIALSYYRSFDLPVKIVRPFNTYGPRQSARAIIPTVFSQLLAGKKEIHLGNLSPTRDLTFVKDTAKGFYEISKSDKAIGKAINIGMNSEITIGELVKLIGKVTGNTDFEIISEVERVRPQRSEVERLFCDNTFIKKYTGWRPEYDLYKGLKETSIWMQENLNIYKTDIYNV